MRFETSEFYYNYDLRFNLG